MVLGCNESVLHEETVGRPDASRLRKRGGCDRAAWWGLLMAIP